MLAFGIWTGLKVHFTNNLKNGTVHKLICKQDLTFAENREVSTFMTFGANGHLHMGATEKTRLEGVAHNNCHR